MKIDFENLREAMGEPQDKLEIVKKVIEDGAMITVGLATFGVHWIGQTQIITTFLRSGTPGLSIRAILKMPSILLWKYAFASF